jgi:MinD-like ATPase involved in chromosome partitioning or flagellar assembly
MSDPMSDRTVTVVGPGGGRDLKLPAEAPLARLLPSVLEAVGAPIDEPPEDGSWRLARSASGDDLLAPYSSLSENGVTDGATLYLSRSTPRSDGRRPPAPPAERPSAEPPRYRLHQRLARTVGAFLSWRSGDPDGADAGETTATESPSPAAPSPASLTALPPLTRRERARQVWRATDYVEQLDALIAGPRLARCATIAVVSPKGGVGKTTITALLGMLLSMLRRDRVVSVDANPDYGSLGRALVPEHRVFVDDFLTLMESQLGAATEVEAQLGRAQHGLLVLPTPTDPARMWGLREPEYAKVIQRLSQYAGVLLLDCGTGLQEPAASAAMTNSDQCILVTDADPAAASLVAEAGQLLAGSGRPITVVVNKMPSSRSFLALERFQTAVPYASALVVVPNEPHAAGRLTTGQFDWRTAPKSWQVALRRLGVAITSEWASLGLAARPASPSPRDAELP